MFDGSLCDVCGRGPLSCLLISTVSILNCQLPMWSLTTQEGMLTASSPHPCTSHALNQQRGSPGNAHTWEALVQATAKQGLVFWTPWMPADSRDSGWQCWSPQHKQADFGPWTTQVGLSVNKVAFREMACCDLAERDSARRVRESQESWEASSSPHYARLFLTQKSTHHKASGIRKFGSFAFLCYCICHFVTPECVCPMCTMDRRHSNRKSDISWCCTALLSGTQINWKQVHFCFVLFCM